MSNNVLTGLAVVIFACSIVLQNQGLSNDAIDQARSLAEQYCLDTEFGLSEYLMEVEVRAESSPNSERVFESKGLMRRLKIKDYTWESCKWTPTIVADHRANKVTDGSLAEKHWWEAVKTSNQIYYVRDPNGNRCEPVAKDSLKEFDRMSAMCVLLSDWPIHGPEFWRTETAEPRTAQIIFGNNRRCFAANKLDHNKNDSYWSTKDKLVKAIHRVTFSDNDLVCHEILYFPNGIDIESGVPDVSPGKLLVRTETDWIHCGDSRVPRSVHTQIHSDPFSNVSVSMMAHIRVLDQSDEKFQLQKAELLKMTSSLKHQ
jgi:hypothetical protein